MMVEKTYTQTQNPKEQNQRLVRTWSGPGAGCCPCFFDSYMCSKTFLQIMLLYVWHLHVLQKVHLHQVCAGTPNYPKIDAFWRKPMDSPRIGRGIPCTVFEWNSMEFVLLAYSILYLYSWFAWFGTHRLPRDFVHSSQCLTCKSQQLAD